MCYIIYPHSHVLISTGIQAILESPEQCLTLCEIYAWFMSNFLYFKETSPTWKVCIIYRYGYKDILTDILTYMYTTDILTYTDIY